MMQTIPLGQVVTYTKHLPKNDLYDRTGEYPVYTFRKGERKHTDFPGLKGNGFILSKYNAPKIKEVQGQFDIMPDCMFFRVWDEFQIDYKYIYYFLLANIGSLRRYYRGSVVQSLAITEFLEMPIRIPSLTEQKAIVAILSAVENAKRIREGQIDIFESFLANHYGRMVGESSSKYWSEVTIGDLVFPGQGIKNIVNVSSDANGYDVILTRKGDAMVYSPNQSCNEVKDSAFCIKLDKDKCNPYYLATVFKFDRSVFAQMKSDSGSSYVLRLRRSELEGIKVKLPGIEQQNDFARVVKEYETILSMMRYLANRLEELGQSLLWKIFHNIDGKDYGSLIENEDICEIYNKIQNCDADDYDIMRGNVYRMLSEGSLEQYFDMTENRIKLRKNETAES